MCVGVYVLVCVWLVVVVVRGGVTTWQRECRSICLISSPENNPMLKSYRNYCILYWNRSPSNYLLPGGISFVLSVRAIYRLWHHLPRVQGISYLSSYTTCLLRPIGHLLIHKVVALLVPLLGHPLPQLTPIMIKYLEPTQAPTKLLHLTSVLGKISPTGVDPRSIISSCN